MNLNKSNNIHSDHQLLIRRISKRLKTWVQDESSKSVKDSQISQAHGSGIGDLDPLLSCDFLDKKVHIKTWFDCVMSSNNHWSNGAQLEMAIVVLFYCENIADQVVEYKKCKYTLKEAWLVGVNLGCQQGSKNDSIFCCM